MSLNANPIVYEDEQAHTYAFMTHDEDHSSYYLDSLFTGFDFSEDMIEDTNDAVTVEEVFDLIRHINDPEHPLSLEQLRVAQRDLIKINGTYIHVSFTPTIPHCSMATLIGLCIRVKLHRSLPRYYKVHISITPGTHAQEDQVNKQLNDKERVAAALENTKLLGVVSKCINNTDSMTSTR